MTPDLFADTTAEGEQTTGILRKMPTTWLSSQQVQYRLPVGESRLVLNDLIGQTLRLEHSGQIYCLHCGEPTNKSFGQGYCYKHFMSLAQNDSCIMSPEKCHYDAGTCREPAWGERNCMQTHYVYLSNASSLKVGITRGGQIPTRWIDQGAIQALAIARVTTRQLAGFLEVAFKNHVADKTNWRTMLKGSAETLDMPAERDRLFEQARAELDPLIEQYGLSAIQLLTHGAVFEFEYPVERYPEKVSSFNFDKTPVVEGTLVGIKGQYLIFDTGVINIRRFGGYEVTVTTR
ncbi:DUF2797 domain-containing protein [Reinekea blandensis]|uniref:DUF2797 domain-containing protein n=1 Tax=Reinekea blandensis MED297 TaxID=314283 RepID=A4BC44_9GAMM|nr:DUF2797 domain-containing protein [Reinekea blandensis]EAR10529.1 hypothetical protein MED297_01870 [Reinekea sp. MED297] [Reinekea blandensis MED297]